MSILNAKCHICGKYYPTYKIKGFELCQDCILKFTTIKELPFNDAKDLEPKGLEPVNGDSSGCGGKRFNQGKLEWHLLPFDALKGVVQVLMFGKQKYGEHNWEKGMGWLTVYNSLIRHVIAWRNGEDKDPESGEHHMSHVICNAVFLLWYSLNGKGKDDRK